MKNAIRNFAPLVCCLLVSFAASIATAQTCCTPCPCVPNYQCTPLTVQPMVVSYACQPSCHAHSQFAITHVQPGCNVIATPCQFARVQPYCGQTWIQPVVFSSPCHCPPIAYDQPIIDQTFTGGIVPGPPSRAECEQLCGAIHPKGTKEFEDCVYACLNGPAPGNENSKRPTPDN